MGDAERQWVSLNVICPAKAAIAGSPGLNSRF
jgi:hypothetical protein